MENKLDVTNCNQEGPTLHVDGEDEAFPMMCNVAIQQEMTIYQGRKLHSTTDWPRLMVENTFWLIGEEYSTGKYY